MTDFCRLIFWTLVDLMRARATLEAEIWVLRQQINVLRRAAPRRQSFGIFDRLIFVGLYGVGDGSGCGRFSPADHRRGRPLPRIGANVPPARTPAHLCAPRPHAGGLAQPRPYPPP